MSGEESRKIEQEYYTIPKHGWTCYFCGETFTKPGAAADHFGPDLDSGPGCLVKVEAGDELGWLMRIRKLEAELAGMRVDQETLDYLQHLLTISETKNKSLYSVAENILIHYSMGWELDEHIVALQKLLPNAKSADPDPTSSDVLRSE